MDSNSLFNYHKLILHSDNLGNVLLLLVSFAVPQDVVVKKMQALSLCVEFCALCDILLHGFSFINENLQALKYRRRGNSYVHQ